MKFGRAQAAVLLGKLVATATGLLLTPDSPCAKDCGNVLSSTTASDMVCLDDPTRYTSTSAGTVYQNCIRCQKESTFSNGGQSDLQWLLYNIRYTISFCLFGFPDSDMKIGSTPCVTSTACGPLMNAIQWQNLTTHAGQYDFCRAWETDQVPKCMSCLNSGEHYVLQNLVVMLDAACTQLPTPGRTIAVSGDPFTTKAIAVIEPTPTGYAFVPESGPLNLGAKVGIAGAGVVVLLAVVGIAIVCNGKRRRRAFLRDLEKRHAQAQIFAAHGGSSQRWPGKPGGGGGGSGGGDMFETPVSMKPLVGGWEASPVSAHTDNTGLSTGLSPAVEHGAGTGPSTFPSRYFSPYNSQYNSPVSAQEAPSTVQWPTAGPVPGWSHGGGHDNLAQLVQLEREQQIRAAAAAAADRATFTPGPPLPYPFEIGLALGGDDPSLRSKRSEQSFQSSSPGQSQSQSQFQPQQPYSDSGATMDNYYPPPPPHPPPSSQQTWSPDIKGKSRDCHQDDYAWSNVDVKGKHREVSGEEFELHEVDSNGSMRVPAPPQAPVLHHPGYGRYPPPPAANRQQWV